MGMDNKIEQDMRREEYSVHLHAGMLSMSIRCQTRLVHTSPAVSAPEAIGLMCTISVLKLNTSSANNSLSLQVLACFGVASRLHPRSLPPV